MYWVGRGVRILDQILDHVVRPTTPRGATCYVSGRVSRDGEGSLLNADFGALFVSDDRNHTPQPSGYNGSGNSPLLCALYQGELAPSCTMQLSLWTTHGAANAQQ